MKRTAPFPARSQNGCPTPPRPAAHAPFAALTQDGDASASGSERAGRKLRLTQSPAARPAVKMAAVTMRLPVARKPVGPGAPRGGEKHLVAPGDTITTDTGYMR